MFPKIISVEGAANSRPQTLTQNIVYNINQTIIPPSFHLPTSSRRNRDSEYHFPSIPEVPSIQQSSNSQEFRRRDQRIHSFPHNDYDRSFYEFNHPSTTHSNQYQAFPNVTGEPSPAQTQVEHHSVQKKSQAQMQIEENPSAQSKSSAGKVKKKRTRRSKYDVPDSMYQRQLVLKDSVETALHLHPQKSRTQFREDQFFIMESLYQRIRYPTLYMKKKVSEQTGLDHNTVRVWFQNRRAREKREAEDELALLADKLGKEQKEKTGVSALSELMQKVNEIFEAPGKPTNKPLRCRKPKTKPKVQPPEEAVVKSLLKKIKKDPRPVSTISKSSDPKFLSNKPIPIASTHSSRSNDPMILPNVPVTNDFRIMRKIMEEEAQCKQQRYEI